MNELKIENILNTLNILYVDSDIQYISKVSEALEMKSNNLFSCNNLNMAIKTYNDNKIDIIIIDTIVNDQNSLAFIKQLRNLNDNICLIVISKKVSEEILIHLIPLKIISFIYKPIDLNLLKSALYLSVKNILKQGLYEVRFMNDCIYNVNKKLLVNSEELPIELTYYEVLFIDALISNRHQVLSAEAFKEMIWKSDYGTSDSAFKSLLNRLRTKIGKESIKTVSGYGYRLIL